MYYKIDLKEITYVIVDWINLTLDNDHDLVNNSI
jgi:hypothetical protein